MKNVSFKKCAARHLSPLQLNLIFFEKNTYFEKVLILIQIKNFLKLMKNKTLCIKKKTDTIKMPLLLFYI
jgi:hypothetical protein